MKIKRIIPIAGTAVILAAVMAGTVYAGDLIDTVNAADEWLNGAATDTADWVNGAIEDTNNWINNAADDTSEWASQAAGDISDWTSGAVNDVSAFVSGLFSPEEEDETTFNMPEPALADNIQKYYLGSTVNAGFDTGFSKEDNITLNDPHFGWDLGRFAVSGYTRAIAEDVENPVFLKTVGDEITLWFHLNQNIDKLNGDSALSISEDKNGYDEYFGIPKTNFGRGALIVRHTDYQNKTGDATIYADYLPALIAGADTMVELFEEGDYEVALNYEIQNSPRKVFGADILPTFTDYRIFFRFSVRNGNCMVFPFDIVTGAELTNSAVTENGFYLDLAKSRYLDINVKKAVLNDTADGLLEDTRFNRPAKDGDEYTGEGIYTITAYNKYTGQETVKKIYVGNNDVLKAVAVNDMSVAEIKNIIAQGGQIADDGTLIMPENN